MKTPHPDPFQYIPISHRDAIRVGTTFTGKQDWEVVAEAIDEWMRRHAADQAGEPEFTGYQWKSVFLPHGTVLRTVFKGKNHHCRVEGDAILYEGKAHSPSGFVNAVGGIRRNAWKSVWLLFPDARHWQLADSLRARKHPAAPRRAAHGARPAKVAPAVTEPVTAPPPSTRAGPPPGPATPAAGAGALPPERRMVFAPPLASRYRWTVRPASP